MASNGDKVTATVVNGTGLSTGENPKKIVDLNITEPDRTDDIIDEEVKGFSDSGEKKDEAGSNAIGSAAGADSGDISPVEEEKRNSRAEKFGTVAAAAVNGTEGTKKAEELKRKARPDRFGVPAAASTTDTTEEEAKKKARLARFGKEHIYEEWFNIADSDGDGRVSGNDATNFFAMSKLSRQELKQVWAVADSKRQGFLGLAEFITAMKLVSLAQVGHEITSDLLKGSVDMRSVELPVLEGLENVVSNQKASKTNVDVEDNVVTKPQVTAKVPWFKSKSIIKPQVNVVTIVDGLKRLYTEKLKPLEVTYGFNDFASPVLTNSDFDAKPMVMLLGPYSTGKTTFIKHLLGCDYPGAHIGPEPTRDRFVVAMSGPDERTIPGNTMAVQADMPFNGLTSFGGAFLSKFECSQMPHPVLDQITLVDTPGVLSGENQRMQRSYDFTGVISWFASKCDMILLLFDPHKLDISDEFKRVITSLRGNEDKIRVVLNKADQVDTHQLMRVYGALMWSLGKVLNTPKVVRVYIGSFNDKPINEAAVGPIGKELFEKEQNDLLADLMDIPKKACDRKINEFVKRARAAKINAYIMSHLKKQMPAMSGKSKAQQRLMDNLQEEFGKVQREFHLPAGDFPSVEHFKEVLGGYNIDKFQKLKPKMIQAVDDMLGYDIPDLLKKFRNPYD